MTEKESRAPTIQRTTRTSLLVATMMFVDARCEGIRREV
jgi:hypothetical protein